jgi:hypothetical protein
MRQGAKDLERMLQALTAISRARRRPFEVVADSLPHLLAGRAVSGAVPETSVTADLAVVDEVLDGLTGTTGAPVEVLAGEAVTLRLPAPAEMPEFEGTPLLALLGSLQAYAGTPVERLAVFEVLLSRVGGGLTAGASGVELRLPLAAGPQT